MVAASMLAPAVAKAVAGRTVEAGTVAAARSANQRTVFMVGHVRTLLVIARGDRRESAQDQPVTEVWATTVALLSMTDQAQQCGTSYASAGVDIEAGDRAVELFKPLAKKATRPEVRGGLGGFAGLFALRGGYREALLGAAPGLVDRRRRHQARGRSGRGQARHRRHRSGRDGRGRPGGVRCRAPVPAGLHRGRPHGAGT